jgi:hypothetical protein
LEVFFDVFVWCVTVEVVQQDPIGLQTLADVLFDSTRNEDSERDGRVFLKEIKHVVDKFVCTLLVLAFVKTVDDNEEWALGTGLL